MAAQALRTAASSKNATTTEISVIPAGLRRLAEPFKSARNAVPERSHVKVERMRA